MLIKNRGFSAIAILVLALGIGVNSAIFSVVNSLLLSPLPFKDSDRLVVLWNRAPGLNIVQDWLAPGEYVDIKENCAAFEDAAIFVSRSFNLTSVDPPERIHGMRVSSSFFSLLGVKPAEGRVFLREEDAPGRPSVVIISNELWRRRFGSDLGLVGKTVHLNGAPATVVGIMPKDFSLGKEMTATVGNIERIDIMLPLPITVEMANDHESWSFNVMGRLKPGVTLSQAQAQIDQLAEGLKQRHPAEYGGNARFSISVVTLLEQVVGDIRVTLLVLFGAAGLVLIIVCANVANLLLSRATSRQKELAIRTALGANRARLLRQLLVESMMLAIAGGTLGLLLSLWSLGALRALSPGNIPRLGEVEIEANVFAFTFIISLLTGIIFGLAPALKASQVNINETLKVGGKSGLIGPCTNRVRSFIVAFEIALSVVILIAAGLLIRSFWKLQNVDPGFSSKNVLTMGMVLAGSKYPNLDSRIVFYQQLWDRLEQIPGIESVGGVSLLPLSPGVGWESIWVEGYPLGSEQVSFQADTRITSPNYFEAIGIPLIKGRFFNAHDTKDSQQVAIIDESFAQRFWPDEDCIGKRIKRGDANSDSPWLTVVGVVRTVRQYSLDSESPRVVFYTPHLQSPSGGMYLVARTNSDPLQMLSAVTGAIKTLDPELPVYDVSSMEQRLSSSLERRRFSMFLLGLFGALALVLSAVGIYGVISFLVAQRAREIGIRMALGAQAGDVLKLVLKQGIRLTAIGIITGIFAALMLTRFMSSLVYGVDMTDTITFIVLPGILATVALAACLIPARRAVKIDPIVAIRHE
jgi:predicted permease